MLRCRLSVTFAESIIAVHSREIVQVLGHVSETRDEITGMIGWTEMSVTRVCYNAGACKPPHPRPVMKSRGCYSA